MLAASSKLRLVKVAHTAAWAVFASAIVLIPVAARLEAWRTCGILIGLVFLECAVLVANGMRCPLTAVAARYTDDRADNFDIYLPVWLARHNKTIFGTMFVLGLVYTLARWLL